MRNYTSTKNPRLQKRPQCGANIINRIGKKYGLLTVIERAENTLQGKSKWLCRCECGGQRIVRGEMLATGRTRSCGCLYVESGRRNQLLQKNTKPPGASARHSILLHYKNRPGKSWELSESEFETIISSPCHYCGLPPSRIRKVSNNGQITYNGIDRIVNSEGYVRGNVVPCCWRCNHAKKTHSVKEFAEWIRRIAEHLESTKWDME